MEEKQETYFVGVRFPGSDKTYYYSTKFMDLKPGDVVLVDSDGTLETATVFTTVMNRSNHQGEMELKPVLRKATADDLKIRSRNEIKAKVLMDLAQQEANAKELPMDFIAAYLSFAGDVITLVYTSTEKRVDFRELLPILGSRLKARVSLRQIASRDRAKMIGGIGICGLPLCCSTFLTNFESIAISKMKNQMLAINIPKYSGPCEKLMCCLAYEDELYAQEKTKYPRIGQEVQLNGETYSVNSFNILSRTVRLSNADHSDFQTFSLEDVIAMQKGTYKPHAEPLPSEKEYVLPDFNIQPRKEDKQSRAESQKQSRNEQQKQSKNDKNTRDSQRKDDNRGKKDSHQQRQNRNDQPSQTEQAQKNNQNRENRKNRGKDGRQNRNGDQTQQKPQEQKQPGGQRNKTHNRPRPQGQNGDAANRPETNSSSGNAAKPQNDRQQRHRFRRGGRDRKGGNGGETA